jgi:uncharacterized protein
MVWGEPLLNFRIIKYISKFLKKKIRNKKIFAGLVTNGTILNPSIIGEFENLLIRRVQVCFDGDEEYHNKSRPFIGGRPSFDIIYKNFLYGVQNFPRLSWGLRINVYKDNMQSIQRLILRLKKDGLNFAKNLDINFNQVFISPFNKCFTECGGHKEISWTIYSLYSFIAKQGFKKIHCLPWYHLCNFMSLFSFVIDPRGDIYKCEELVGKKEFCIGNVKEGPNDLKIIQYFYANPYEKKSAHKKCQRCKILPYCNGFCPIAKFLDFKIEDVLNSNIFCLRC